MDSRKLYILFGATGQVGGRLLLKLKSDPQATLMAVSKDEVDFAESPETMSKQLDVLKARVEVELQKAPAQVVLIMAAGYTHVDGCELTPRLCDQINITRTIDALDWGKHHWNAKLVFYSTDYVFDGVAGPYTEDAEMRPLSRYGQAKKTVEDWLSNAPNSLVIRTTGVFDYNRTSKNFLIQVLERLKKGEPIQAVNDQFANPVWAKELTDITVELVQAGAHGVYHVAGAAMMSRAEFARTIARVFGFSNAVIQEMATSKLRQAALRPMRGGLVCNKVQNLLGHAPSSAEAALKELARIFS